jgi:hypothetical protein
MIVTTLSRELSERLFELTSQDEIDEWLRDVSIEIGGVAWLPLGGIDNNVHTVEVASDPALALVERPINGIDALLDLVARERGETAPTPHAGAQRWWDVPVAGLGDMTDSRRRDLGSLLRVAMLESGQTSRPTITIQDAGTGQLPDDFPTTLLSLLASNKKTNKHQMGVYNAGGAASCRFARSTIIVSRLAPSLLNGQADEIGVSVIRYDALDPEKYKSGSYMYLAVKDHSILRLDLDELPDLPYGTYVKLVEYELSKYARAAYEPKSSLWHLFHAALPSPPLPLQILETRAERFPGVRGDIERRTVSGLLYLLGRSGTADYSDVREINMGPDVGTVTLRYYVLNEGTDPDAYTTSDQGLTITLNGQRQITKDRAWVKRNLQLPFLFKRIVIVVDGTGLTSATKRDVFSATRESGVDTPAARKILERVIVELIEDEHLSELDELAKQRVLEDATKTTTDRVKRQLASQIGAYLSGKLSGRMGGGTSKRKRRVRRRRPPRMIDIDDSLMLDIPDRLAIVNNPIKIAPGGTTPLRLEINAKNDFLPRYAECLSVVVGPGLAEHVSVRSKGRLLGGRVRVTLEAASDAPEASSTLQVALVVPALGVLLTANGTLVVAKPKEEEKDGKRGGEPNIDVRWVGREKWDQWDPAWDAETVGVCYIRREDPTNPDAITRVEWILNENFAPYEQVVSEKNLGEEGIRRFKEGYEYPVLFGLFKQQLAEEQKEREADDEGRPFEIPDDYVRGEQARMARAVLMAMEPNITLAEVVEAAA